MMFGQCAVFVAVRDVVRARGACVFVFGVGVCNVACVACRCALFCVTRAMMVTCRCGGWACGVLCVSAGVCGVMVAGSAALVGMCVRCALSLRKSAVLWLCHTRDVRCASWVFIAGAVLSRAVYCCIATFCSGFLMSRVRRCTACRCGWCVTEQHRAPLFCGWLLVFVRPAALRACALNRHVGVGER